MIPARSRHRDFDFWILDFGFWIALNPNSQIPFPKSISREPASKLLPDGCSRQAFEVSTAVIRALFSSNENRALLILDFRFWILDLRLKLTAKFRLVAVSVCLSLSFACNGGSLDAPPAVVATREVRDDLGRTVVVPEKIDRAISLAPSVTEMIFAVGAGDKLVGVTTYCNYPIEAAEIAKVGDTQTPNIERIIALRPQIVFVSTASQLEAFMSTLAEQGIGVYVTDAKSLDEVFENLKELGELLGKSDYATNYVASLSGRVSDVRQQVKDRRNDPPRVFLQISNDPLFTIGKESFMTELVEQAGGVSITKDVATAYPTLSKETAAALDPEVIILSDSEDNRVPNPVLKNSRAVRAGQVYSIDADILSRPGPRLVDALEQIAAKLKEID